MTSIGDIPNPEHPAAGPQRIPRPESWQPGPPRRWPEPTPDRVERVLEHLAPVDDEADVGAMRASAVLALLAPAANGFDVLLTRRSQQMNNHSGEVSFAGGRIDAGETPIAAALREADEEVGLDPAGVRVRGELGHHQTWVSRSYIVPVVGTVAAPQPLVARTIEVDRVLWVPLAEFTRDGVYHSERWDFGDRYPEPVDIHFFELEQFGETVWGATARMLVDLLDRL